MRQAIRVTVCVLGLAAASIATVRAEERSDQTVAVESALQQSARKAASEAASADVAAGLGAQQGVASTLGQPNEHQLGLGLRTGGYNLGIGGSVRSWFQPHWGVQIGVAHYGNGDPFGVSYTSNQFTPAVLYQFGPITVSAPMKLRPYVGAGISIIRSSFAYLNNADTTDTTVLILGGVEIFFDRLPQLGVSGELEFAPSSSPYASVGGVGGPGFVAIAHWYVK
jgi:hypothetical protein